MKVSHFIHNIKNENMNKLFEFISFYHILTVISANIILRWQLR